MPLKLVDRFRLHTLILHSYSLEICCWTHFLLENKLPNRLSPVKPNAPNKLNKHIPMQVKRFLVHKSSHLPLHIFYLLLQQLILLVLIVAPK